MHSKERHHPRMGAAPITDRSLHACDGSEDATAVTGSVVHSEHDRVAHVEAGSSPCTAYSGRGGRLMHRAAVLGVLLSLLHALWMPVCKMHRSVCWVG